MMPVKTGAQNRPWVAIEKPKPPPVDDEMRYWGERPPELSERCRYWIRQFDLGWRPNRRIQTLGYHSSADWYGVYIWEYLHVIAPRATRP
ncbi:hypothetical protein KNU21_gp20 [Gordonia phage Nordenberg]|uniref:Uncharacterized protein n=1 Tax=Gordonia phage Nordenberg TaxID=2483672 RepID=A0A3G3MAT6_9CAUD|nr:hypothetical protein KNU21_gp20 [Gordonia phage Nordenberg]AYR03084.1 hypothetical protein SEA_NORDENBERG_20 [Gordonia phage Nordenberg]